MATCIVDVDPLVSTFWILAANSWMQTPGGFAGNADGRIIPPGASTDRRLFKGVREKRQKWMAMYHSSMIGPVDTGAS